MLASKKVEMRRSRIREEIAVLAGKENRSEDESRALDALDKEYSESERSYRGHLIAEDEERKAANEDFADSEKREFNKLVDGFELRQLCAALDDGSQLSGQTLEVVTEMRSHGSYQGLPVPLMALERRTGETVSSGTPDPRQTRPIIDRLFPQSVVARLGGSLINIDSGEVEWPVATGGAVVGWGATELGDVGAATQYTTIDKALSPDYHMGAQMVISRKSLKQSGAALEQAIQRDLNSAIATELDRVAFLGAGSGGEPLGLITGAVTYGFDVNVINAAASYAAFRAAAVEFLTRNAAATFKDIRLMFRHEILNTLDSTIFETGSATTEYDFVVSRFGSVFSTGHALAAPAGSPAESTAVMTTSVGGVPPFFMGIWGGVDLIRDPFTKAASGQLVLTGLVTADVTCARAAQVGLITELQ